MVYKCSALNCRSGYNSEKTDVSVTFHSFPLNNKDLLVLWLKRMVRKDFSPTKYFKLCSLHFKTEDFIVHSVDKQTRRQKKRTNSFLGRKRLKDDAVPSVFQDIPKYYATNDAPTRSGLALSSSRLEKEAKTLNAQLEAFLNEDKVQDLDELLSKISSEAHDKGFLLQKSNNFCNFILLSQGHPLSIHVYISVTRNLEVTVYQNQEIVPLSSYKHIMQSNKIKLVSEFTNLLAFSKNLENNRLTMDDTFNAKFSQLVNKHLEKNENDEHRRFFKFILEQVDLHFKNKKQRRYSVDLLMMAYVIHATSPRAYERLIGEKILILPSTKTLKNITMKLDRKNGLDDTQYLKMQFGQLNSFNRNVLLMIDEIYLSKRIEATRGEIFGLTEESEVATTALCFMIKSLSSNYQDMVAVYPVKKLKAETQKQCYDKIMHLLHSVGFNVVAISCDNAAVNRKFYINLCNGTLINESITNDFGGGKIFLIFDPTHVIKNIYDNFQSKRIFQLPRLEPLVANNITARFSDIEEVHNNEYHKPSKIAHKLTETVMKPKTIEKVNVKLAMSLLHDRQLTL